MKKKKYNKKATAHIQKHDWYRREIKMALKSNVMFSRIKRFEGCENIQRDRLTQLIKSNVAILLAEYFWYDNIKCSYGNKANTSLFSKAAHSQYFGINEAFDAIRNKVLRSWYDHQNNSSKRMDMSISGGLDPRFRRIHYMYPEMTNLRNLVREIVAIDYMDYGLNNVECDFNTCEVKFYYWIPGRNEANSLNMHTDISANRQRTIALESNMQKPGTPTVILTFGNDKWLHFRQLQPGNDVPIKEYHFLQSNGSMIIQDWRDELVCHNKPHYFKHASNLVNPHEAAISIIFRVSQEAKAVEAVEGNFVNPVVPGTGVLQQKLDEGLCELKENYDDYYEKRNHLYVKMLRSLMPHFSGRESLPGQILKYWQLRKNTSPCNWPFNKELLQSLESE